MSKKEKLKNLRKFYQKFVFSFITSNLLIIISIKIHWRKPGYYDLHSWQIRYDILRQNCCQVKYRKSGNTDQKKTFNGRRISHTDRPSVDMHQHSHTTSNVYGQISRNHIGMTSVTVASCIKTLFQLSARPRQMLKTAEREQERIPGDPLLPSYSPCLEAYSELSWQTKISLFLYNTCFFFFFFSVEEAKWIYAHSNMDYHTKTRLS